MPALKKKLVLGFCLAIAAYAHASEGAREATQKELAAIKAGLETQLKDASSARFSNVRVDGEGSFCGLVNSKNGFGAYGGYTPVTGLLFDMNGKLTAHVMGLDSPEAVQLVCEDKGLSLPPI
ncbi:hypothetical protein HFK18_20925|uniref:hypothetical protein n=1 Tax=Stenotrophomonas sp. SbOxS2 TaxID=2723885 RepID=UPI0015D2C37F|nr:hypothetical protein [Stenotrophomonas sp. SbOxS2]NYU00933.1 hypothetical protein [Stenotrophomonas sp. SbOxS2]